MKQGITAGIVGICLAISAQAAGADVAKGLRAKAAEDYKTALREFRKSADAGEEAAMYELGLMYGSGLGVPKDPDIYADWMQRAAELGYVKAENVVGIIYMFDRNKPEIGFKWFQRAADQGNADGMVNVAYSYKNGLGVPANGEKAVEYYSLALEAGMIDAGYQIGLIYYNGKVVPKDFAKAAEFFKRGADQDHAKSEFFLAYLYYAGEGVEQDAEAFERYRRRAARHGLIRAQLELGEHYAGYFAWDQDYQQGAEWYEMAAKQGSVKGMVGLLAALRAAEKDDGTVLKTEKPYLYWLQEAARRGDGASNWELASRYQQGNGVPKDEARAKELGAAAVAAHLPAAMHDMGMYKMRNAGSQQEFQEGFELIYGAAVQHEAAAMLTLAQLLGEGQVIQKNLRAGFMWVVEAKRESYGPGREQLDAVEAAFAKEMGADFTESVKNYVHNNCDDFYDCVLRASNYPPELAAALTKYRPEYYE